MSSSKKLLFLTGSRGEWGYIKPLLRMCKDLEHVEYRLCVTNMHLVPAFGWSVKEIENEGFEVHHRLHMSLDGYSHITMTKSLGILLLSLADVVESEKPDWIILAGDRGEQLMGAIVGAFCYIPIAHIQAGELSGNIDGMTRHAIGKYAHLHFASNSDASDRLRRLGEEDFRIHNVGAPQLDDLVEGRFSTKEVVAERLGIDLSHKFILLVQHPVTEDYSKSKGQIIETLDALNRFSEPKVVILPNNDAGSLMIREGIEEHRSGEYHVFANVRREDYLCLLRSAMCIVGNSSSGILEAPTCGVPVVNLGRRQHGRIRASNVIDETFEAERIYAAIKKGISKKFQKENLSNCVNPYGDGYSSERIIKILRDAPITDSLLAKNLTY